MNVGLWGCRHCGNPYEGTRNKGENDKCPHCELLQSKSYEEQVEQRIGEK